MRLSVLKANGHDLARSCAVLLVAGMASGCSSQVARFNGVDDVFTASTSNQRSIINKQPASQPFPGDVQAQAAPADGTYSRSVTRSSLEPVSAQPLPPPAQPMQVASAPAVKDVGRKTTGTVAAPAMPAEASQAADASRVRHITVQSGETLSGLSSRFGVPGSVIMAANGLSDANGLKAGQKLVIPARGGKFSAKTPFPDTTRNLADMKPAGKVPLPASTPAERVAVLPQQPKLKEDKAAAQVDSSAAGQPKNAPKVAAAAEQPKAAAGAYTVRQGDTLSAIARKSGVSVVALKQANGLQDGILRIGQTLKVPVAAKIGAAMASAEPAAADPVVTGSTGPAKKTTPTETLAAYTPPKKDLKVIQQAEDLDAVAPDSTGIGKMRWPVRGRVIAGFGSGKGGDGIDIAVPEGTPVKAAENGVVIYAGNGLKEFGNTVLVRHEDGLVTVYGHASSLQVTRGQKVKRGQEIALSGMSGTTDSPKLHFEVRKNSAPVDPSSYLE